MEYLGILLLVLGFVLIGIEMVLPGFGAPGISGIVSLTAAVLIIAATVEQGLMMTVAIIVLAAIMMTIIMGLLSSKKVKAPIVLEAELKPNDALLDSKDLEYLVGKEGRATTDLKPVGKGSFDGILLDVRSESAYLSKGTAVRISRIHENSIMVQEMK